MTHILENYNFPDFLKYVSKNVDVTSKRHQVLDIFLRNTHAIISRKYNIMIMGRTIALLSR